MPETMTQAAQATIAKTSMSLSAIRCSMSGRGGSFRSSGFFRNVNAIVGLHHVGIAALRRLRGAGELRVHVQELSLEALRRAAELRVILAELAYRRRQPLRTYHNKNDGDPHKPLAGAHTVENQRLDHLALFLINRELAAAVLSPRGLVMTVDRRLLLAVAAGLNAIVGDSALHEVVADDDRAIFTERHVVLVGATLVAVALDHDHTVGLVRQVLRDRVDLADLALRDDGGIEAEVNRLEAHVGAARAIVLELALGHAVQRAFLGGEVHPVGTAVAGTAPMASLVIFAPRRRERKSNSANHRNR